MSLLRNLSSNQVPWAVELINKGQRVIPSCIGVKADAAVMSVAMPESRIGEGLLDLPLQAAIGVLNKHNVDSKIFAFDTMLPEFNISSKRALVVVSEDNEMAYTPLLTIGNTVYAGETELVTIESLFFNEVKNFKAKSNKDWLNISFNMKNNIFNLEERFTQI